MKRYIVIFVLIISILFPAFTFTVSATNTNIVIEKAGIDEMTNKINVRGKVENAMTNTVLTLVILMPNANTNGIKDTEVLHIDQTLLNTFDKDHNIAFSFTPFDMPVFADTGDYKVIVSGQKAYNMGSKQASYHYIGLDTSYQSLVAFDNADLSNISAIVNQNADYLSINKEIYNDLSIYAKALINPMLVAINSSPTECSDYEINPQSLQKLYGKLVILRKEYKKIILIGQFRDANTILKVTNWIDNYSNHFSYGEIGYDMDYDFDGQKDVQSEPSVVNQLNERELIYSIYSGMTKDEKNKTLEFMISKSDLKTIDEIRETFYNAIILKAIELLPWTKTKFVLDSFPNKFNLNYTSFNQLNNTNKDKVYQAIGGNSYPTLIDVNVAFENNASSELINQNKTQVSISGSSSGGGGGVIFSATANVSIEDSQNNRASSFKTNFSDISYVQWAKEAIEYLSENGIIHGKTENIFAPNDYITRSEFTKILICGFHLLDESAKTGLVDTNENDWHYKYIASAQKYAIVFGYSDGSFGINDFISRQDMAVMLSRAASTVGIIFDKPKRAVEFVDFDLVTKDAKEAVINLTQQGIINGVTPNEFAPKSYATRAQAAKLIYDLLGFVK